MSFSIRGSSIRWLLLAAMLGTSLPIAQAHAQRDWRRGGHGYYRPPGRDYRGRGGGGAFLGGALLGLGVGALAGGALAQPRAYYAPPPPVYYQPPPPMAYAPPPGVYYNPY